MNKHELLDLYLIFIKWLAKLRLSPRQPNKKKTAHKMIQMIKLMSSHNHSKTALINTALFQRKF